MKNDPEWLSQTEAAALAGRVMACPDGVLREVLLLQVARSAAPYVYREGSGPCFLTRDAIEAVRKIVTATAADAGIATPSEANPV